jgi:AcrR family transcriptional regulator
VETVPLGLRERSKRRRRRAIQVAALRLFTDRGYEGATLSDIAEAADVAPRTVSLYFPSKLDLVLSEANETAARVSTIFQAESAAGFIELIERWLDQDAEFSDPELAALSDAMFAANPHLRALGSGPISEAIRVGSDVLFRDIGLNAADPLAAIVAASVGAAIIEYHRTVSVEPTLIPELLPQLLRFLQTMISPAWRGSVSAPG